MPLGFESRTLSPHLGCEIRNLDVRTLADDAVLEEVLQLIYAHHVLVFRKLNLAPDELLAFTRRFGEIDGSHVQSRFTLPGYPDIFVISNVEEKDGKPIGTRTVGHHWHTDWAYKSHPAAYTLLYGVEVPAKPHHTLFASERRVYDLLSEEEKAALRARKGRYNFEKTHSAKSFYPPLTAEQRAMTPTVEHPLLRIHPGTGKEGLYLSRADCIGVSGMSDEEGLALVNRLVEQVVDPAHIYAHPWEEGDLVMWDNRCVMHSATPYDMENDRRRIYRTTVKGERPIAPAMPAEPAEAVG